MLLWVCVANTEKVRKVMVLGAKFPRLMAGVERKTASEVSNSSVNQEARGR